jgi:protoporphyrinogen/coproporphyrinogen III oxidase
VKFAVVGGGIAGLAAAWELVGPDAPGPDVTVFEAGQLGGKLRTTSFLGQPVDEAPDSLITRVPEGVALCEELGLSDELVAPAATRAVLFAQGKLRPLPGGLVLGAPARLLPLMRSRILSPAGMARASFDAVLPRSTLGADASVFSLISSRFGSEVADRLVEPLLGTIHAGTTKQLSAAATAPQLLNAAKTSRSLMAGLRRMPTSATAAASAQRPLFVAPRQGMQCLADRLVEQLGAAGARFFPAEVSALRRQGRSVVVEPAGELFDGVVLAVPAPAAFSLLEPMLGPGAPGPLATMSFASVAVVTLGFESDAFEVPADLSGVLVTPASGLLMTACSFGSHKWPHWSKAGTTVLRVSVGRIGDEAWARLSDEALAERLCEELTTVLSGQSRATLPPVPVGWRVSRWPRSMPQYEVGHLERVARAKEALAQQVPMIALAGASYGGVGVPSCIGSGRRAGRELRAAVQSLGLPAA